MKYNITLSKSWDEIGRLRNDIRDKVKAAMGWAGNGPFYDRLYGRVNCTPAEQMAFKNAFAEVILQISHDFAQKDLFPADDCIPVTVE